MDDLATTLFEEAHEMVRGEKAARHEAEKRMAEAQSKIDVMEEELKALKTIVSHLSGVFFFLTCFGRER